MDNKPANKPAKPMKYTKATHRRIRVLLFFLLIVVFFSALYISTGIGNIISSNKLLADKKIALQQEQQRKSILEEDIKKLSDPEYIRQYARGEFHYTSNDEIIFILPPEVVADDDDSTAVAEEA